MKRIISGAVCAVALAGLSSTAVSLPIYFDFTGSLTHTPDGAAIGQAISGGFTLETDRLVEGPQSTQRWWYDSRPASLVEHSAHLDLGGTNIALPLYAGQSDAAVTYSDNCTPGCANFGRDHFSISVSSSDQPFSPGGFNGTVHQSALYFTSLAVNRPAGGPIEFFDYFDLADISLDSILTLPLYEVSGFYAEDTLECAAFSCRITERRQYDFSIDTVARGVGARSVPEPGTLGLLGGGLLAALLMRRRHNRPHVGVVIG